MTPLPSKAAETTPQPKPAWRPRPPVATRPPERTGTGAPRPAVSNSAALALARTQPRGGLPAGAVRRPAPPPGTSNAAAVAAVAGQSAADAGVTVQATGKAGPTGRTHENLGTPAHGHAIAAHAAHTARHAAGGHAADGDVGARGASAVPHAAHGHVARHAVGPGQTPAPALGPVAQAGGDKGEHGAAPAGAAHDPAFQQLVGRVHGAAAGQRKHAPSSAKAAQAQAAAVSPPGETQGLAADKHVQEMDAQKPRAFNRAAFKAALLARIAATAPKTLGDAARFKEEGKLGAAKAELHGTVDDGKKEAAGPIADAAAKAPDQSGIPAKPVSPLAGPEPSPPPPDVGAGQAAPKPRPESEVSLKSGPAALDQQMSAAGVNDEQLKKSNEPAFQSALGAKQEVAVQSAVAPDKLRVDEKTTLAAARGGMGAVAHANLGAMHGARGKGLSASQALQIATKAADEAKRAEVSAHILGIYDKAKVAVEARLKRLDEEVDKTFDAGATAAQKAFEDYVDKRMTDYKVNRYLLTTGGSLLWAKDQILNLPDEVNAFYEGGRKLYIDQMDGVLDGVAATVETGLAETKAIISGARTEIASYVAGLDPALQEVGHKAATDIGKKLDELDQSVTDKQNDLIENITRKYNDALQKVDDRIGEMKAANKGLLDQAKEAVAGVIQTILNLKNMLLGVLARAANAIDLVIKDPIKFLGNLVSAVGLGVKNFASRIGEHLKQGFMEWLFGAVAQAGIQLPKTFDMKGIVTLVLQVLGLTYASFRARAVELLGEKVVSALETAAEIFKKLIAEGPAGVWEWIKEKLGDLKALVIDKIKEFIIQRVIVAGVTWLIGLLNPASAFVKACKAIYDIIMFFVERGSQILALVNAVIDSVTAIAMGQLGGAATMVETALARAIPVVIGFLASLLGVGGISEKIKSTIETIRRPFATARDWVINLAVKAVKAAGKFVAGLFGGKEKVKGKELYEDDPEKSAKVRAGLAALDTAEKAHEKNGKISRKDAESVAKEAKGKHPIFKSIIVVDGGKRWDYKYSASPEEIHAGGEMDEGEVLSPANIWEEVIANVQSKSDAKTHLDETSVRHGMQQLEKIFSTENVPSSQANEALRIIGQLADQALTETTGDKISARMRSVSGVANAALRAGGSGTIINAHHIQQVSKNVGTFPETKKERTYIPVKYKKAIEKWVNDLRNKGLSAEDINAKKAELVKVLRDQLFDDKHANLDQPLQEVEMVITTATAHSAAHKKIE
ncbi:hypothetical protein LMG28614_00734 [Paraburkholderia ultramafica]|uniref:Uncharacterized protein n=1 Tax=Paraburkholderia ultramafica TaxID=1544867 RepID=A0A6S7AV08_9BURK|nr:hypothetical protein [Paraburkholderia ultramafica]CAB3778790.1 hypothetical protein LMG28614_00734 [Paraburkholderia ultramafica]